ncbi:hypothetical protein F2P81_021988 [Scophthalmus maximus]|uniref:Uncharacterized protein n=1 Tax=Scophthalmus maximus TaxID=52904 RepID=A0A6A4RXC8_SCOMX|nr:hypothetical protein F2P81_021988 [Scophthalmus maximus]
MVTIWLCGLKAGCAYSTREVESDDRSLPQARAMQRPPTPAEPDQSCRKQLALVAMYHTHEAAVNIDLKGGPIVNGNFD